MGIISPTVPQTPCTTITAPRWLLDDLQITSSGTLNLTTSAPIKITTPPGTRAIYMSAMSHDTDFSSSKLSWRIKNHSYSLNFTRQEGAGDVLVDETSGLPISAITESILDEMALVLGMASSEDPWQIGVVNDPVATRVGLDGSATMIQVKFRCPNVDPFEVPEWTTVTILYRGITDCAGVVAESHYSSTPSLHLKR
jgi:hypothetical protein